MIDTTPCPGREELERLLLGDMPGVEMQALEGHVSRCPRCLEVARQVRAEDALVAAVRAGGRAEGISRDEVEEGLIAQLCRLRGETVPTKPLAFETPPPPCVPPAERAEELSGLLAPPGAPDELGRLGPYGILRVLGSGGMGVVFAARQERPRRVVALKMIVAGPRVGGQHLQRFRDESEILARLRHPNIVQVHEVGEHDGRPYFTMEYAEGGSLAQKLAAAPLVPRAAAELIQTLAGAVHSAHEQGIVHRDLKPSNVLLEGDGTPRVGDFGLAKQLHDAPGRASDGGRTETGAILGTPGYMAPEQAAGQSKEVGPAADVYALGAILYECLTGRPPFRAATILETLEQVRSQEPVPPSRLQPGLPRDLQTVCLKCLEKEPARRYTSAQELADDLRRFLDGVPLRARPVPVWERAWRWARRRPAAAGLLVLSGVAVAGLLAGLWWHTTQLNAQVRRAEAGELKARQQHELADARYQAARTSLRRMLDRLESRRLADVPRLKELHRDLLEDALAFYQTVLQQADNPDPAVRLDAAVALVGTACTQDRLGQTEPARDNFRRAVTLLEELPEEYRDRADSQEYLGVCHRWLGNQDQLAQQWEEAERHFRANLGIAERRAREESDQSGWLWQNEVARAEHLLGQLAQGAGRLPEAETCYLRAVAIRTKLVEAHHADEAVQVNLAETYQNLGAVYGSQKRWPEAQAANDKALGPMKQWADQHPQYRVSLAAVYLNAGDVLWNTGKPREALERLTQAVDLAEAILQKEPQLMEAVDRAYNCHGRRAQVHEQLGRWADAARDWDRAVELDRQPDRWVRRYFRAIALARAGEHARAAAEAEALEKEPKIVGDAVYNLACVQALAAAAARSDTRLSTAEQGRLAERYAARAMVLLQKLRAEGYFKDAGHAGTLATDEDLQALSGRPDFRQLLEQVKSRKSPAP
jgi:tetratricopeptide (TPR) repeat protein